MSNLAPTIENISMQDIVIGLHKANSSNACLIQITDFDSCEFVKPRLEFSKVFRFKFDDVEQQSDKSITKQQAIELSKILKQCYLDNIPVVVHCHAGICRSGAVAEVGNMLGFDDIGNFKIPNLLVKNLLLDELGLRVSPKYSMFAEDFYDTRFD